MTIRIFSQVRNFMSTFSLSKVFPAKTFLWANCLFFGNCINYRRTEIHQEKNYIPNTYNHFNLTMCSFLITHCFAFKTKLRNPLRDLGWISFISVVFHFRFLGKQPNQDRRHTCKEEHSTVI